MPETLSERQRATAEYLTDMILELRNLARSAELHAVMVPLEFAYYEAFGMAHRVDISAADLKHLEELAKTPVRFDRDPGNRGI